MTGTATTSAARNPLYHDEGVARRHVESIRWPEGPLCPYCDATEKARPLGGTSMGPGWYRCTCCRRKFTVRVGSMLERSHIPLHKWIHAAALITGSRRPFSVRQLRRLTGVSYRSAFVMACRIKQAMSDSESV
jgi:transposase-like protein